MSKKYYEVFVGPVTETPTVESLQLELLNVSNALDFSKERGLESEVFLWSLKAMKENPNLTIEEALISGVNEWIK